MRRYFLFVTRHPRLVLVAVAAVVIPVALLITRIRFDYQPDSFIPDRHPALLSKRKVERVFGLEDPMLLGVIVVDAEGRPLRGRVYTERPLRLIRSLTESIQTYLNETFRAPGPHPVYSLATEYRIEMVGGLPEEMPFLDPFPETEADFRALEKSIHDLELYDGALVSRDGSAGAIVVVPPPGHSDDVYEFVAALVKDHREPGIRLALAGEAAVRAAVGRAVVTSSLRLNPLSILMVIVFLCLAFRNAVGVFLPLAVVGCGSMAMLGLMCGVGIPVYLITTAILVTVLSLGVADAIHVLGEYYREIGRGQGVSRQRLVVRANERLWVPVFYTSVTDMAGFLSFFVSGVVLPLYMMPPLKWFGFFTAVGVGATLLASFTILPAALMYVNPAANSQRRQGGWAATGYLASGLSRLGDAVLRHPLYWLGGGATLVVVGIGCALQLKSDQSMVSTFDESSEIVQDDRSLNQLFDGTYFLDVLIEGERSGALLEPAVLRRIERLEEHATDLEHVNGSLSVAGFARKMHQIYNNWDRDYYRVPDDAETVRFLFDQLEPDPRTGRRGSPTKLAELRRVVDTDFRLANVRLRLSTGEYLEERAIVEEMERYLRDSFLPESGLTASLSGRVNLDYHWMLLIQRSHVSSVSLALAVIVVFLIVLFRSALSGLLCLLPVGFAVLTTYAVMGAAGIPLSIGTSMFASLAIGVGVNFPIHFLDRLRVSLERDGLSLREAFRDTYSLTGKALCFNAMAVSCGFLALLVSELPLLRHFGLMIAVAISSCCAATLTLLPAAVAVRARLNLRTESVRRRKP